ncbi:MAG: hypothetical protein CL878_12705 [Dehalococcoidia bacterium]|nr:hypothetical protein [Dehalococcoidia bacterium]
MPRFWLVLAATSSVLGMASLDTLAVTTAIPDIQRDFGLSPAEAAWVVAAYVLGLVSVIVPGGRFADTYGRKRLTLVGVNVFLAMSVLCGLAPSAAVLVAARFAQGVGAGLMLPPGRAIIVDAFPKERIGTAFGIGASVSGIAIVAGPTVGGLLTDLLSWRAIFFINVPLGIVALLLVVVYVSESRDPLPRRVDAPGMIAMFILTASIATMLLQLSRWGARSVAVGALLVVAVLGLVGLVAVERKRTDGLVRLDLFRRTEFAYAVGARFALSIAGLSTAFFMLLYMQDVLGYTALQAGAGILPLVGTAIVMATVSGVLVDRFGERPVVFGGLSLVLAGLVVLLFVTRDVGYLYLFVGFLIIIEFNCSLA